MNFIITTEQLRYGKAALIDINTGNENTFTKNTLEELTQILKNTAGDNDLNGILFHSNNGKFFSNGLDTGNLYRTSEELLETELFALTDFFQELLLFPKPVVAELAGHAMGAGAVLAIGCDYRYMMKKAGRIGFPEVHLGLPMPGSFVSRLREMVSRRNLNELCLEGRAWKGEKAFETGLVGQTAETREELRGMSLNKLNDLFKIPFQSFNLAKYGLNNSITDAFEKDKNSMRTIISQKNFKDQLKENLGKILKQ